MRSRHQTDNKLKNTTGDGKDNKAERYGIIGKEE
jgi:hypothetical protein